MVEQQDDFGKYIQENLAADNVHDRGTAIPADSLAQIMQEIIKLDPELANFVGTEIRTGYMDDETLMVYSRLLIYAYHILVRGSMFGVPMKNTAKDILFAAKVIASSSTSKGGKLLETLVMSKREVRVEIPKEKKGIFSHK